MIKREQGKKNTLVPVENVVQCFFVFSFWFYVELFRRVFFSLGPNLERSFKESASNFSINGHFRLLSHFFVSLFQVDSEHLPVRTTPSICPVGYLSLPTSPQFLSSPADTFESEQSEHGSESSSIVETSTKSSTCNVFQVKVQVKFCLPSSLSRVYTQSDRKCPISFHNRIV